MRKLYLCLNVDCDTCDNNQYIPELSLLAAVLGRALQDLSDKKERKHALHWFLSPSSSDDGGISFEMCLSVLKLSTLHMEIIKQRIRDTLSGNFHLTRHQKLRRVGR